MDSRKILVVEDEEVIRHVLTSYLATMECEVTAAESAEEAVPLVENEIFDVALLDIVLPGMNGIELLGKIKEASPGTEVIIMTSHASVDTATAAIRSGAYDYILKPFEDIDDVWATTRRALDKRILTAHNRQLMKDLAQRNAELSQAVKRRDSLNEAGQKMSGMWNLSDLLSYLIGLVAEELDVDRASLMLLDDADKTLSIAAAKGLPQDVVSETSLRVGEGIAGTVAKTGELIHIKDARADLMMDKEVRTDLANSFISAPIVVSMPITSRDKVLGVINLTNRRSEAPFEDEDVAFVRGLAGQAAVAIERARYVTALEKAIETLENTQAQLVASERLKAFGQLAAGIAHDFNNSMNGVLLRAQSVQQRLGQPAPDMAGVRVDLEMIEDLALQAADFVKQLQSFTRIRKDRPSEAVDMNILIKQAVQITEPQWKSKAAAGGRQIDLELALCDNAHVVGAATELTQVIGNLIFNAVEAMPEGGTITIATQRNADTVELVLTDTGVGMTEEVQTRLFEPFFTTKDTGQGLGTSIIFGIVTRHGGEIAVTSEEGKGTQFTIQLPAHHGPVAAVSPTRPCTEAPTLPAGKTRCVLVIDDEAQNTLIYNEILKELGYAVLTADDGAKGLALMDQEAVDVVITDLSMPGMSGWEVAKAVKARDARIPVLLLSGWAVQEEEAELKNSGVDLVLSKPCPLNDLAAALESVLANKKAA